MGLPQLLVYSNLGACILSSELQKEIEKLPTVWSCKDGNKNSINIYWKHVFQNYTVKFENTKTLHYNV